jgi:hypothetical protein
MGLYLRMQEKTTDTEHEGQWEIFTAVRVDSKNRIDVVDALTSLVYEHRFDGNCIYWSFDKEQEIIVVSNGELGSSRFENYGRSAYYSHNEKIVPPANLRERVDGHISSGKEVYYLADSNMQESENCSAFVLTTAQISKEIDSIQPVPNNF